MAGVKFLTMAIDFFRNEKVHTADGNISDPIRAYEYLRLSSLAMHLLEGGQIRSSWVDRPIQTRLRSQTPPVAGVYKHGDGRVKLQESD